jgi:hypothetical protein
MHRACEGEQGAHFPAPARENPRTNQRMTTTLAVRTSSRRASLSQ